MITRSGRHIQILERRNCSKCGAVSDQICHKVSYEINPDEAETLIKRSCWICSICTNESEEVKTQPLPSDKTRIINSLLRLQGHYAIQRMNIASYPAKLLVEITTKE